jgi:ClpP class serine protease
MKKLQEAIIAVVKEKPGINAVELTSKAIKKFYNDLNPTPEERVEFIDCSFGKTLDEMVKDEMIQEVEYILFGQPDRIKSIFFPVDAQITIL